MRVLVACEFSGIVREAFRKEGHFVWSCDIRRTEKRGRHFTGNVLGILNYNWDLMIAHPPCTHLAVSGARWFKDKQQEQKDALRFVEILLNAPIPRIAVENPVSIISSHIRKPDQIIQPWQFGHKEMKTTCLWLKNLPPLVPTDVVGPPPPKGTEERKSWERVWRMPPNGWNGKSTRDRERSRTYTGVALAMARQWGGLDVKA